ncbi:hypothetical protein ES703_79970 [subsurface metagenome]
MGGVIDKLIILICFHVFPFYELIHFVVRKSMPWPSEQLVVKAFKYLCRIHRYRTPNQIWFKIGIEFIKCLRSFIVVIHSFFESDSCVEYGKCFHDWYKGYPIRLFQRNSILYSF